MVTQYIGIDSIYMDSHLELRMTVECRRTLGHPHGYLLSTDGNKIDIHIHLL